ncbi:MULTISPECIES: peroxiredoxin [unclassified Paenarthrobacter]|uniref:peroxiredoxin n=1 Tax=unclassified Paenarthrobacter TaxID=2634190 RepID=UPI003CE8A8D2
MTDGDQSREDPQVPRPGQQAPDFELSNQYGEPVRLSAFRGRNVVMIFYPFAFSGICTSELQAVRDHLPAFEELDAVVLALSVDSKFALRAFAAQEIFDFDLLADFWPHGAVAREYGVFDEATGMARRGSFVIDAHGIVRFAVVNPRGQAREHTDYLRALSNLAGIQA